MKQIWKYQLEIVDNQIILMPENAEILSVANQRETLCLWALVDPEALKKERHIRIIGTGNNIHHSFYKEKFIGTVLMENGFLVWHVFEVIQ